MMTAVDQADSAQYTMHDILEPSDWTLLNFLMDARTGLGRFHQYRISNYQLMMELIDHCTYMPISEILELPDVVERIEMYESQDELYRLQVKRCATVHNDVVCLDLRDEETIYVSNRFMLYAMFPGCRVSMHVLNGLRGQNTVFAVGKSIVNRGSPGQHRCADARVRWRRTRERRHLPGRQRRGGNGEDISHRADARRACGLDAGIGLSERSENKPFRVHREGAKNAKKRSNGGCPKPLWRAPCHGVSFSP